MGQSQPGIMFVHGILSNCESAFRPMADSILNDPRFAIWKVLGYDYDYNSHILENAKGLAVEINKEFPTHDVTLICHSMGGLVGRLAILSGAIPQVKTLIMLGTPNFGALRTASLGLFSQLSLYHTGKLFAYFCSEGIHDLTRINEIFKEQIRENFENALNVQYVTIPGTYFHGDRKPWDIGDWGGKDNKIWTTFFAGINVATEVLSAIPLWKINLKKPHDGIVELESNCLIPDEAGRHSEKASSINHGKFRGKFSYAHAEHTECSELTHVMLQKNEKIIALVKEIILVDDIYKWYQKLPEKEVMSLKLQFD